MLPLSLEPVAESTMKGVNSVTWASGSELSGPELEAGYRHAVCCDVWFVGLNFRLVSK